MKKSKKNTTNKSTLTPEMEEYFKEVDIGLANLEKIGAAFLIFGYANYIRAAEIDILEICDKNNTGTTPGAVTTFGQKSVLLGYVIAYIVSNNRVNEKKLQQELEPDNTTIDVSDYEAVKISYLISIFANALRLQAFINIEKNTGGGEVIE